MLLFDVSECFKESPIQFSSNTDFSAPTRNYGFIFIGKTRHEETPQSKNADETTVLRRETSDTCR